MYNPGTTNAISSSVNLQLPEVCWECLFSLSSICIVFSFSCRYCSAHCRDTPVMSTCIVTYLPHIIVIMHLNGLFRLFLDKKYTLHLSLNVYKNQPKHIWIALAMLACFKASFIILIFIYVFLIKICLYFSFGSVKGVLKYACKHVESMFSTFGNKNYAYT